MQNIEKKIKDLLNQDPYKLDLKIKKKKILDIFRHQIKHHIKNCPSYRIWYKKNFFMKPEKIVNFKSIPYLPSTIFKMLNLKSSKFSSKVISSSGSTGQQKSRINLDSKTSNLQKICLTKILSSALNNKRRPFFIVDIEPSENFNQNTISARYAGMSGYLMAASSKHYLFKLDSDKKIILNKETFSRLKKVFRLEPIVIIGYTYMLWNYLFQNDEFNFKKMLCHKDTKILHFGGWKKLEKKKVSKEDFIKEVKKKINIKSNNILDIYGFSEQLGTIYVSKGLRGCEVSSYSHLLIRDPKTLEVVKDGDIGFIQFLSILPLSYPGFSILTDDIGYISKREVIKNVEKIEFKIHSRLDKMEPRGCGDTLPANYYV